MAYSAWSVSGGEVPTTAKWNILGTNDASFNDGTGIGSRAITSTHIGVGPVVQCVNSSYSAQATGTTTLPMDDTVPQNTEGTEFMTCTITPKATTNKLVITAVFFGTQSVADNLTMALFQDTTASALAAVAEWQTTANGLTNLILTHYMTAGTTSATTFKIRVGMASAGTVAMNGSTAARLLGGITKSSITITEIGA